MLNNKINSYSDYSKATAWKKLEFLANEKHNDKHIVHIEKKIYTEKCIVNKLVFKFN